MKRFLSEAGLLQAGQFALIVVQAATNIVLIRLLGADLLGAYTLIQTLVGLLAVLDVSGSVRVVVTQLAQALGAADNDEIRDVLAYFWRINLQLNVPLVVIFFFFAPVVAQTLYHNDTISNLIRWLALTQLTDMPTQIITVVYQCRGDFLRLVIYETGKVVLTSLVMLGALVLGWGLEGVIIGTLAVGLVYAVLSILLYHRLAAQDERFPSWKALIQRMKTVGIRERFRLGFLIAIDRNLGSLVDKAVLLLFGTMGTVFVGKFGIALKIITLPQPLISGLARYMDTFLPKRAGKNANDLQSVFVRTTLYTGAIWAVGTFGMVVAAPILLLIFFPKDTDVVPLLYPLLLQSLAVGLGVGIGPMLRTIKRLEIPVVVQIVELLVTIPAGYVLINALGVSGAAWLYGLQQFLVTVVMIILVYQLLRVRMVTGKKPTVMLEVE